MKDFGLVVRTMVRVMVAFIGFSFLLGQLFFGIFEWHSTIAGLGGLAAAGLMGLPVKSGPTLSKVGIIGGVAGLLGLGVDIYDYYANLNGSGNYYAWFLTLPYAAGIIFLMVAARRGLTLR